MTIKKYKRKYDDRPCSECENTFRVRHDASTKKCPNCRGVRGLRNHKLYNAHQNMLTRCYNSKFKDYSFYGGKGIIVDDIWKNNFLAFYDWAIANGYKDGLVLDRINSDNKYCPANCRWITNQENSRRATQRSACGANSILTEEEAINAIAMYNTGNFTYKEIGNRYNVTAGCIFNIRKKHELGV